MKHALDYGTSSASSPHLCCTAVLQIPAGKRIVKPKARFPSAARHSLHWLFFHNPFLKEKEFL